jgi:hypothetical protein
MLKICLFLRSGLGIGKPPVLFSDKIKMGLHCEKSFFVLASRHKIPVLRTENLVVDTRTIWLPVTADTAGNPGK